MSLYARAASLIQSLIQGSEAHLRPEIDAVLGDLHGAHAAETQAVAPGAGRRITIDGAPEGGFLVSVHNGTLFRSFVVAADDEAAALRQGLERFAEAVEHNPVPQAELAPATPSEPMPAARTPHVERPFDGDPGTLDVTRGRVGDEAPDEDRRAAVEPAEGEPVEGEPVGTEPEPREVEHAGETHGAEG